MALSIGKNPLAGRAGAAVSVVVDFLADRAVAAGVVVDPLSGRAGASAVDEFLSGRACAGANTALQGEPGGAGAAGSAGNSALPSRAGAAGSIGKNPLAGRADAAGSIGQNPLAGRAGIAGSIGQNPLAGRADAAGVVAAEFLSGRADAADSNVKNPLSGRTGAFGRADGVGGRRNNPGSVVRVAVVDIGQGCFATAGFCGKARSGPKTSEQRGESAALSLNKQVGWPPSWLSAFRVETTQACKFVPEGSP